MKPPLAERFVVLEREPFSDLLRNLPSVFGPLPLVELEETVELLSPIPHVERTPPLGLLLCVVEVHGDEPVQLPNFFLIQVILRDGDVGLPDLSALPSGEAHVGLRG